MHPILGRPARLAAYLGVWVPLGMLLAALLDLQGAFHWVDATIVALPLVTCTPGPEIKKSTDLPMVLV